MQKHNAKGVLLSVPALNDKELESTSIQVHDKELANKVDMDVRVDAQILIWCILVCPPCYDAIESNPSATIVVGEVGESCCSLCFLSSPFLFGERDPTLRLRFLLRSVRSLLCRSHLLQQSHDSQASHHETE